MPTYTAYPTVSEVQNLLRGNGLLSSTLTDAQLSIDWQGYIDGVVSEFEEATRHRPFLADNETTTLQIPVDRPTTLLSLPSSFATVTGVTVKYLGRGGAGETPTALTQGSDYDLSPISAGSQSKPYTSLRLYEPYTRRTSMLIAVTGRLGYATTLPPAVFQAILEMAAVRLESVFRGASSAIVERIKLNGIEKEFSTSVTERLRLQNQAETNWKAVIARFRKVSIV